VSLKSSSINVWRQVFGTSISKFVNSIGVILLIVILTLEFSVNEIGIYFFLFAVIDLLSNIAGGFGKALRKRVSAREGKQSSYLTTTMVSTFIMQIGISSLMVITFFLIPKNYIPNIISGLSYELILSSLVLLFAQSTGKIMINYNSGLGYPSRSEWLGRALPGVLFFVLSVVIIFAGLGLTYIFVAGSISFGLSAILLLYTTRPKLTERPTYKKFRSLVSFGKWSIPNKIIMDFYSSLDAIALGIFVTSTAVGFYESSSNLSHIVYTVPYGVGAVLSVKISGLDAEGKSKKIKSVVRQTVPVSIVLPVTALFFFILFGEFSLKILYGSEFLGAYAFLVGMSTKEIIMAYRRPIQDLNYGLDKPEVPFYANISSVVFNVTTVLPFIYLFGGIGVVISTIIAEAIRAIVLSYHSISYVRYINYRKLVTPFIVGVPVSLVFWQIQVQTGTTSPVFILIQSISFLLTFISITYLLFVRLSD
jgi:O-antigen/teichoic acid export membrane protein